MAETAQLDLESLRELINLRLHQLVPEGPANGPAQAARYSLLAGGKRLRAIITLVAARSCGGKIEDAVDPACAVEMIHTASLVFDDLPAMDDAELRRGRETVHVAFGEEIALLAGIGLMNGAYEAVARARGLSAEQRIEIHNIVTRAVGWQGLVHGQALDLGADRGRTVETIHEGKTGALFIAAAESGAVIAGSSDESQRRSLRVFGRSLGFAYQAFDDVLDQACDDKATGKTTGRDGGKTTAVLSGQGSLAAAQEVAHGHLDKAVAAVGEGSGLAHLAEFIRSYFTRTIAA